MTIRTSDFDYDLPSDLIAQEPAARRDEARMMVFDRGTGTISHDTVGHLGTYLHPGDRLVANRSRVIPARLWARRATGGKVEILLLRPQSHGAWTALVRPGRKIRAGERLAVAGSDLELVPVESGQDGQWVLQVEGAGNVQEKLRAAGTVPLPPYISNPNAPLDRYQTVYADVDGSVAAPTAGLHLTDEMLAAMRESGMGVSFVTLHVGIGTFRPVQVEDALQHQMHAEWGEVPADVAKDINHTIDAGGRVLAIGTTTTRLLESAGRSGRLEPFTGDTDIFIVPGFEFKIVGGLLTNFHLPKSTLMMLVSALIGREALLAAYAEAVRLRYRFYSFGDAMLIL